MTVSVLVFMLAMIFGLMLAEARLSSSNEASLRSRGAVVPAGDIYPVMSAVYPLAFLLMGAEGIWRVIQAGPMADGAAAPGLGDPGPNWFAAGLLMFVVSKGLKYWAIRSLGERWTFRVVVLPSAPLVCTGPYQYVTHPNYVAVVGELVGTAMMMRAVIAGPVMVALFGLVLWARIRFENRVLRPSS